MIDIKYWQFTLKHFEKNKYFENGLTMPFLIGCGEVISPNCNCLTIEEFTHELISSKVPVNVMYCNKLKEHVFSLEDRESTMHRTKFQGHFKEFGNLIATDSSFDYIQSSALLINMFKEKYLIRLQNQTYSKNIGKWTYFTLKELQQLNELKALLK